MLYVLHNNVCSKPLLYSVGKKLLKLVKTPLNVGLWKIHVYSALLVISALLVTLIVFIGS